MQFGSLGAAHFGAVQLWASLPHALARVRFCASTIRKAFLKRVVFALQLVDCAPSDGGAMVSVSARAGLGCIT